MPPPEVPVLLPGSPPTSTKEVTEQPESRYYSLEKMWAGTHPAVQGGIILGLTVVFVMLIRAFAPVAVPLVRIWRGRPEKEPVDAPAPPPPPPPPPYTPPPEPSDADKRHAELLAAMERGAAEARAAKQIAYNLVAEVRVLEATVGDVKRRIGDIETRLTTAVTREEMGIALNLVSDLARRS